MDNCSTCRYFTEGPVRRFDRNDSITNHEEGMIVIADGKCTRLPKWEDVNEGHSCGEYTESK